MNKKLLTVAIAGAMAVPMSAQAVKYKLSGQVNRAVVFQDDGQDSGMRSIDNGASGTRFRLRGSEDLGNGMQVGFYWELQTQSARNGAARPNLNGDGDDGTFGGGDLRQANVYFSGNWGKLTMGQTDGAANGGTEADLSGTAIAGVYHTQTSFNGAMRWRTGAGGCVTPAGAGTGANTAQAGCATGGTFFSGFDGFSRHDVIRYDSPKLGPVKLAASVGNDSVWEVAATANTALGGGQLSAALFYGQDSQGALTGQPGTDARWGGSLSFLFSQGTNITLSYAKNEPDANGVSDADVYGIKLGHKWGDNAVAIMYGEAEDVGATATLSPETTMWSVGYVRTLKKVNTELYASFIHSELDLSGAAATARGIEDQNIFLVGARVKFD
jgi:predicted porin